jgi:hypothetical protein
MQPNEEVCMSQRVPRTENPRKRFISFTTLTAQNMVMCVPVTTERK